MAKAITTKDRGPDKGFDEIKQRGLKALSLATEHAAALTPRLGAGLVDGLVSDLGKLGAVVPNALATRVASKTATATQNDKLSEGHALVSAIRHNVSQAGVSADVKKGYGSGRAAILGS